MKRVFFSVILLTFSCAVVGEKTEHKSDIQAPPAVTGDVLLTFAGTIGNKSTIAAPRGISFGIDGTLYVCDRDNSSILRFDTAGNVISLFNGFDSRTERLFLPVDVSVSGGIEIYALDGADSRVFRFDRNLKNAYVIYTPESDEKRLFGTFAGLAFDTVTGDLFITDRDNGTLLRIDMLGGNIHTSGTYGSEKQSLRKPEGLDIASDGSIVIADSGNGAVAVLRHFGAEIEFIGKGLLDTPVDVAILPDDLIAVADRSGVIVLDPAGTAHAFTGYGIDMEMFPRAVAFSDGKIYISDTRSSSVLIYNMIVE